MFLEDLIIEKLKNKIKNKELIIGIGDDASVIRNDKNYYYIITKDLLIEGTHFLWKYHREDDLAYKSIVVNLSDCISMGVYPRFILLGLGIPKQENRKRIDNFIKSFKIYLKRFKIGLIGGDTVKSDKWVISITMIGVSKEPVIRRSTIKKGDLVYITGHPGLSKLGFEILENSKTIDRKNSAVIQHLKPQLDHRFILRLVKEKLITSMMDVSDGLSKDLYSFIYQSKYGVMIFEDKFLYHPLLKNLNNRIKYFLNGGEDYLFLFTAEEKNRDKIFGIAKRYRVVLQEIGRVIKKNRVYLKTKSGKIKIVKRMTYEHF
ncbi:MAG: thiamine-phosphate kinase [Candidatus Hydrogenedentota bacterium]